MLASGYRSRSKLKVEKLKGTQDNRCLVVIAISFGSKESGQHRETNTSCPRRLGLIGSPSCLTAEPKGSCFAFADSAGLRLVVSAAGEVVSAMQVCLVYLSAAFVRSTLPPSLPSSLSLSPLLSPSTTTTVCTHQTCSRKSVFAYEEAGKRKHDFFRHMFIYILRYLFIYHLLSFFPTYLLPSIMKLFSVSSVCEYEQYKLEMKRNCGPITVMSHVFL